MRLAFVCPRLELTGGDHILFHHASGMRAAGHDVDVYAAGWSDAARASRRDFNSKAFRAAGAVVEYKFGRLADHHDFSGYDLVVANGLFGAYQAARISHSKKVWFCQNFDPWVFPNMEAGRIDAVYRSFDNYLLYSRSLREVIAQRYGRKNFELCTNGVEYDELKRYQRPGVKNGNRVCFMVGYYGKLKGIDMADVIFEKLAARGFQTVEINANQNRLALKTAAEYYNNPSFEDKCRIVAGCDVSVHPSVFETWSLVAMESMGLGAPVVGFNSQGVKEYATSDNSILFDERAPDLVVDAIVGLCRDRSRYLELQENGIATARRHCWTRIMPSIESSYRAFLEIPDD